MSVKINYLKKNINKSSINLVLFSNDKFKIDSLKSYISESEFSYIKDLLNTSDKKKNLFVFEVSSKKNIVLISIKNNLKTSDIENLGAEFYGRLNNGKNKEYNIISDSIISKQGNFLGYFLHGIKLKSYEFKKYKTKKDTRLITLNILGTKKIPPFKDQIKFKALEEELFTLETLCLNLETYFIQMNMLGD